jgi:hypothetical protein
MKEEDVKLFLECEPSQTGKECSATGTFWVDDLAQTHYMLVQQVLQLFLVSSSITRK